MKHDKLTKELFEKWNNIRHRKDVPIKKLIKENALGDLEQNDTVASPQYAKPIKDAIPVLQDLGDAIVVGLSGIEGDYDEYAKLPGAVMYKGKKFFKAGFNSDKHYAVYKLGDNFATAVYESSKKEIKKENNDALKYSAVEQLINTYDFNPDMDPYEEIRYFEADNGVKFSKEERKEIVSLFWKEWRGYQKKAGVKKPLTPSQRRKAYRDLETDE